MKNINSKILFSSFLGAICIVPLSVWAINTVATGFQTTTSDVEIDAHSTCQNVKHTWSNSYFVPTKTSAEWSAFRNNTPSDVALSACGGGGWWDDLPTNLVDIFDPSEPFDDYWTSNTCDPNAINVISITPWTDKIPSSVPANTIYSLAWGNYIQSYGVGINNCSAIVSENGANIYASQFLGTFTSAMRMSGVNGIFYWLTIDGENDGSWGTHQRVRSGFYVGADNNTIYKSKAFRYDLYGIRSQWYDNAYIYEVTTAYNGESGMSIGLSHRVDKCLSYWNVKDWIEALQLAPHISNCRFYNNWEKWLSLSTTWISAILNNVLSYNNQAFSTTVWYRDAISNSAFFNNGWNGIWSYHNTTWDRVVYNSVMFKNSWDWISVDSSSPLTAINVKSYGKTGRQIWLRSTWGGLKYYWSLKKFDSDFVFSSTKLTQWTDWFLWFPNGVIDDTWTFNATWAIVPSVSWWNINTESFQAWTYDENITYTFGSNIPNQSQPIRYNTTTNSYEFYWVDGVDYDSTKKIGEW